MALLATHAVAQQTCAKRVSRGTRDVSNLTVDHPWISGSPPLCRAVAVPALLESSLPATATNVHVARHQPLDLIVISSNKQGFKRV